MPYGWAAAASLLVGGLSADASQSSGKVQADAANRGVALTGDMFAQNKASMQPWVNSGQLANNQLLYMMGLGPQSGVNDWQSLLKSGYSDWFSAHPTANTGALTALDDMIGKSSSPTDTSAYGISIPDFAKSMGVGSPSNIGSVMNAFQSGTGVPGSSGGMPSSTPGGSPMYGVLTRQPGMNDIQIDPSFGFITKTQEDALANRFSTGAGGGNGGNMAKALVDYSTGAASTEYGNAYARYQQWLNSLTSRLGGVSSTGVNAAGGVAGLGASAAGNMADLMGQSANATAAGRVGSTNALLGGGTDAMNNYMFMKMMQQNQQSGGTAMNSDMMQGSFDPSNVGMA